MICLDRMFEKCKGENDIHAMESALCSDMGCHGKSWEKAAVALLRAIILYIIEADARRDINTIGIMAGYYFKNRDSEDNNTLSVLFEYLDQKDANSPAVRYFNEFMSFENKDRCIAASAVLSAAEKNSEKKEIAS